MTWLQLRRLMRDAGWRFAGRTFYDSGRDEDGAPWDEGGYHLTWKRAVSADPEEGAAEISACWGIDDWKPIDTVSYFPYGADYDWRHGASVGIPMIEELGLDWLCDAMKAARIIPES
jgi:hypothetical protein